MCDDRMYCAVGEHMNSEKAHHFKKYIICILKKVKTYEWKKIKRKK